MKIRINNGKLIDPANGLNSKGSICIKDGLIISAGKPFARFKPDLEIDASDKWVCPGIIDLCARFGEPGQQFKATIESESNAAASAGVTAICCPPDTQPVIDTPAVVELIHQRAEKANRTHIYPIAALTNGLEGERLAELYTLKQAGCIAVSNANQAVPNNEVLRRAMEYSASTDLTVFINAQDHFLANNGVVNEGAISTRLGLPPIPETAETVAVSTALLLVEQTKGRAHFCRLSSAKSVEMIARAKKAGLPVSADVSICHLHLTEMDVDGYDTNCHLVPPLRTLEDKNALIQGLISGAIDAVCSDHQPHNEDAKTAPFSLTKPGASTIEILLPMMLDLVSKDLLSPVRAIECLTINPARILGIDSGSLAVGKIADITIIDPEKSWSFTKEQMLSTGKNTPFDEWELFGKVTHTIYKGQVVYQTK